MARKSHLAKSAPYADTHVPYGQTKNDIEEMLKEAGAVAMRWTETPESMRDVELPVLEFIVENKVIGENEEVLEVQNIPIRIKPPLTGKRVRRDRKYGEMINVANKNGSMRLLYWYLKSRFEAARFGLEDMSTTFMGKRILTLPDKETGKMKSTTLAEVVRERPEILRGLLPSFKLETDNSLEDMSGE